MADIFLPGEEERSFSPMTLHKAAREGRLDYCQYFLDLGHNVNGLDIYGVTPLYYATVNEHMHIIEFLLNRGADMNFRDSSGYTLFHHVAKIGNLQLVRFLFLKAQYLVNVQQTGWEGVAPIHLASAYGHVEVVSWFIFEAGVNVDTLSLSGKSALMYAAQHNHVDVVIFLIRINAILHYQSYNEGLTALHYAVRNKNYIMVKALVETGRSMPSALCYIYYKSPVHWALEYGYFNIFVTVAATWGDAMAQVGDSIGNRPIHLAVIYGDLNAVLWLHRCRGVIVNDYNNLGYGPLHVAAERNRARIAKYLVEEAGLDIDMKTNQAPVETALHIASRNDSNTVVKYLIDHGADLNLLSSYNSYRPVHYATAANSIECVTLLHQRGCDFNFDYLPGHVSGEPLLITAAKHNSYIVAMFLLVEGINVPSVDLYGLSALHHAIQKGDREIINLLLTQRVLINSIDDNGQTPLHYAVERGDTNILNDVLQMSPIRMKDNRGMTPLHLAAANGHLSCLQMLMPDHIMLQLEASDRDKNPPIHLAAIGGHTDVVRWIIGEGIDVDACDKYQRTVLFNSVQHGHLELTRFLLEKGASVNGSVEYRERTPLHVAVRNRNHDLAVLLIEYGANLKAKEFITQYTPLHLAVLNNDLNIARSLVLSGADTEASSIEGDTARSLARSRNFVDIINLLDSMEIFIE
jgi:ankyrin repeat protein